MDNMYIFLECCFTGQLNTDDLVVELLDSDQLERGIELAAEHNNMDVIEWIVAHTQDRHLFLTSAINYAIDHENVSLIKLLVEAKQSEKYLDLDYDDGVFLLNACKKDNVEIVSYLLQKQGVENWKFPLRISNILMSILNADSLRVLTFLLHEAMFDKSVLAYDNGQALRFALEERNDEIATILLECPDYPLCQVHDHFFLKAIKENDTSMLNFLLGITGHGCLTVLPSEMVFSDLDDEPDIKTDLMLLWKNIDYISYLEILPEFTAWCNDCGYESLLSGVLAYRGSDPSFIFEEALLFNNM